MSNVILKFMIIKKLILVIFLASFLGGCAQNVALLGPMYTLSSTGNIYQAGLSYGSDRAIKSLTGKSAAKNIEELIVDKKDDSEFVKLVKRRVKETRKKLNFIK